MLDCEQSLCQFSVSGDGDNVHDADSDDDFLLDGLEKLRGTNPLNPNSDDDGLSDAQEVQAGTNPNKRDGDGDGQRYGQRYGDGQRYGHSLIDFHHV